MDFFFLHSNVRFSEVYPSIYQQDLGRCYCDELPKGSFRSRALCPQQGIISQIFSTRNREKKEKWINLEMTVELINCKPAHASVPRGEHPSKFKFLLQSRCSEEVLKFVFQTAIWETSHDFNNRFFCVRPRHRQAQLWASRLLAAMSYSLLLVRMEIHAASFDQWQIPCSLAERASRCSDKITNSFLIWQPRCKAAWYQGRAKVSQIGTPVVGREGRHCRNKGINQVVGYQLRSNTSRHCVSSVLDCTLWMDMKLLVEVTCFSRKQKIANCAWRTGTFFTNIEKDFFSRIVWVATGWSSTAQDLNPEKHKQSALNSLKVSCPKKFISQG